MDVVTPRIEKAVRSITGSSGRGPNSVAQNPDQRGFSGNMEETPLTTASSRADLNIDQDGNDETCSVEHFEDGDVLTLRPNYERQSHTHHRLLWKRYSNGKQIERCGSQCYQGWCWSSNNQSGLWFEHICEGSENLKLETEFQSSVSCVQKSIWH